MKEKILISLFGILLLLSVANADVVKTSTGFIWTNITFDNRTLLDWDFYIYNSSTCNPIYCGGDIVISNLESNEFFLIFKVIPSPADSCFYNYQSCPTTGFDTKILVNYSRPAYVGLFDKYTSNWGSSQVDVSSCWNWWNNTDFDKREAQKRNCPLVAIKVDKKAEACNMFWQYNSPTGATPNYYAELIGYDVTYVDIDNKISPPIMAFLRSLTQFEGIVIDIWKVAYYTVAVILIIADLILVLGVFPLGLRWVIKKLTGD